MAPSNSWADLRRAGAHLIRLHGKTPLAGIQWSKRSATLYETHDHVAAGGQVGVIPASLGAVVIDVDNPGLLAEAPQYGAELCRYQSPSGGWHIWQACSEPPGNRKWAGGDIRGRAGYVVIWEPETLAAAIAGLGPRPSASWPAPDPGPRAAATEPLGLPPIGPEGLERAARALAARLKSLDGPICDIA